MPDVFAVCDRIVSYPTKLRVLILQHFQEQDALLGSAQIAVARDAGAEVTVGFVAEILGDANLPPFEIPEPAPSGSSSPSP